MKKIRDVMTKDIETIGPDDTLVEAAEKMRALNVGPLPVCRADKPIGMLTDRDIVVRAVALGRDPRATKVGDVMSPDIEYCSEDDDLDDAAKLMKEKQIRRLLVLDDDKKLCGIVSLGDMAVEREDVAAEALEGISEPAAPATD